MVEKVVQNLAQSTKQIDDGTMFVRNFIINDVDFIKNLDRLNCIENIYDSNRSRLNVDEASVNQEIILELSLAHLNSIGYFESTEVFIIKNKTECPDKFYIQDIDYLSTKRDTNSFVEKYLNIISITISLRALSDKFNDVNAGVTTLFIFRENSALILPLIYCNADIGQTILEESKAKCVSDVFNGDLNERKILYINELISFLNPIEEEKRFVYLLNNFDSFYSKCENSFQYYLRNFSYNKLKAELDNSALDYSKKIQSIINEAQTKLIAIPVAFVLAASSIDWVDIFSIKNIVILFSLFIFATLIEIFLSNQSSSLAILKNNIRSYKASFGNNNQVVRDSFSSVDNEFIKQNNRLTLIRCITWGIPILLTLVFVVKSFIILSPLKFLLICFILTLPI